MIFPFLPVWLDMCSRSRSVNCKFHRFPSHRKGSCPCPFPILFPCSKSLRIWGKIVYGSRLPFSGGSHMIPWRVGWESPKFTLWGLSQMASGGTGRLESHGSSTVATAHLGDWFWRYLQSNSFCQYERSGTWSEVWVKFGGEGWSLGL